MKCPACGFDSPEGAQWCDFCKEPFFKKAPKPTPARPTSGGVIPSEFAALDAGERIPIIPKWVRLVSWGFLALWALVGLIVFGFYIAKKGFGF